MYTLENLIKSSQDAMTEIDGKYVPARPESFSGPYGLWLRVKNAWHVLTGKADAFTWPGNQ